MESETRLAGKRFITTLLSHGYGVLGNTRSCRDRRWNTMLFAVFVFAYSPGVFYSHMGNHLLLAACALQLDTNPRLSFS